ncbi:MAG TPA: hypothetical protein VEA36_02865 [Candidatus Paceibacterota bacterium]|nr:hypothetical protein [Candidatus Paceibacterota bacterium]
MTTLAEVGESRARLRTRTPRDQPEHLTAVWHEADGVRYARATLSALGFSTPPLWAEVLDRVRAYGGHCDFADLPRIGEGLIELADAVRPAMPAQGGEIVVCIGDASVGKVRVPIEPARHISLDVEVAYRLAA